MKRFITFTIALFAMTTVWAVEGSERFDRIDGYVVDKGEFNCSKYGPDSIKAIQYFSLYREYFKQENFEEAMKYWPYVYENAPALQSYVLRDGLTYYKNLVKTTEDGPEREEYKEWMWKLYDHRIACFGGEVDLLARKGLDMLKYDGKNYDAILSTYHTVVEKGGDKTPYYVLKPYFQILLRQLAKEKVSADYVLETKEQIVTIAQNNKDHKKYSAKYLKVVDDIELMFQNDPVIQSLFNCDKMKPYWEEEYRADPNNLNFIKTTYNNMRNGCKDDPFTDELFLKLIDLEPTADRWRWKASQEAKVQNYEEAIGYMTKAADMETDAEKIAGDNYKIAEMYYVEGDFPTARSFAKKAISANPNWGKPYILIGKLYASSGKRCGPGTGLESQRVIWPALDYFSKAKSVDSSVASEAQQLINKYWAYLPEKSDIFMQWGKGDGEAYFVPCWIQESTTIRTK